MNLNDLVNKKVINKKGEVGVISRIDNSIIYVTFPNRNACFELDSFTKGFLKFEEDSLQECVVKEIENEQRKLEEIEKEKQLSIEKNKKIQEQLRNITDDTISNFRKEYFYLSNFYRCEFEFEGIKYFSSEAAFQAQKASTIEGKMKYSQITNPVMAKRMGKKEPIDIKKWNEESYDLMKRILKVKFSIPELKEKLLSTGDKLIVEGNNHHDNLWGMCMCESCKHKPHQNKLGLILMEIRDELRKEVI